MLSQLRQSVTGCGTNKFNISRCHIWEGARRAILRASFSPTLPLSVKFTDDIGNAEGAVDQGGPRREFLQLLTEYLATDSPLFVGDCGNKHLNALQQGTVIDYPLVVLTTDAMITAVDSLISIAALIDGTNA